MILATRFTVIVIVIVEKGKKKTCHFTQKWLDHLLLNLTQNVCER